MSRKSSTTSNKQKPELYDASLRAVAAAWREDKPCPGLVLAYLEKENKFYASICRYHRNSSSADRRVIYAAKADSIDQAVVQVMEKLLADGNIWQNAREAIS